MASLIFALSIWIFLDQRSFLAKATSTTGVVIDLVNQGSTSQGRVMKAPVVEFKDSNGVSRRFASRTSSYPARYVVGDHVEVLFDPDSPHDARIQERGVAQYMPFIIFGMGVLFACFGLFLFLYAPWAIREGWNPVGG